MPFSRYFSLISFAAFHFAFAAAAMIRLFLPFRHAYFHDIFFVVLSPPPLSLIISLRR